MLKCVLHLDTLLALESQAADSLLHCSATCTAFEEVDFWSSYEQQA